MTDTNPPQPVELLRRTEAYLSALHGSVARHDNLAANFGCAGCELRDQIGVALRAAVSAPAPAPTDETALSGTERRSCAECGHTPASHTAGEDPVTPGVCLQCEATGDVDDAHHDYASAPADRAAILREAADWLEGDGRAVQRMFGHQAAALLRGRAAAVSGSGRVADETQAEAQACTEFGTWFDRSICPEPCGAMHQRCDACGAAIGGCPNDAVVSQPDEEA